ncbi:MAG: SdrD B-like domain-containing protein [Clostridia bacterium]
MPVINKTVDKTIVNGSEIFIYTFNVSYSGLIQPAQNGKLVDFFPSEIVYQLPPVGGQLVSITPIAAPGGTNVEFNFGPVNAGTSLTFTVSCEFGPGRSNGDTFTNVAKLYADNVLMETATAPMVTLNLTKNFILMKSPAISAPVVPGQVVTFMINLQNKGDAGAELTNISITDILPATLIPVTSYLPVGNDTGTSQYTDTTYNGRTGTWTGNTLNFTLPSYKGIEYKILFKATVAADVVPGSRITNTADWTANGTAMPPASTTFTVFENIANAMLQKGAPEFAKIGEPILYYLLSKNTGTVNFDNCIMIDTLPKEVDITKISFSFGGELPEKYSLYIETSNAVGTYIPVLTNSSINSGAIDLSPFITPGNRVLSVKAEISSVTPINIGNWLYLYGSVNNSATLNQIITNNSNLSATSSLGNLTKTSNANTTLNGRSILNISKTISPELSAYYPLNEFRINLLTSTNTSMIINPVLSDLLPLGIAYIPNSYYYVFTDIFTGKTYDSRNPGFPIQAPIPEIIKNYNSTGRTLVKFSFTNYILQLLSTIQVFFDVIVELNPPSSFTNIGYEGNPGNNTVIDGIAYNDVLDLDVDTITNEQIAQSNAITAAILTTSEFSLEKWVKGNQDTNFSKSGFTTAGGKIIYNLNVTNNQNTNLQNIDMVDILPYVGDTGVILNTTPRQSQFNVYANTVVTAKIVNILGDPVDPNPDITIEYSTSKDPIRFDQTGTGTIGSGTWSIVPPSDITTIQAIRVTTGKSVILKPYERLIVTIDALAPVGTLINKIAYNSFAVKADKLVGGVLSPMNPAEPNKVSVQIASSQMGSIGNFVWNDLNSNGIYDLQEPGVNGITVQLYDENNNLLQTTTTTNDFLNNPGYYNFTNLTAGNYYVKFIPNNVYGLTISQPSVVNGSKPNQTTGLSDLITLNTSQVITTMIAGLVSKQCNPPVINASNKRILLGTTFNPLTGVTATDCLGDDITSSIIVTANDVDTSKVGVYHVTYSVTDKNGQTTIKTIIVIVYTTDSRDQAINDIIESVALMQTALSHIINAEGEKIQKVLEIKSTNEEMIKINNSVEKTINNITNLEIILKSKLEIFKCKYCNM